MKTRRHIAKSKSGHWTASLMCNGIKLFKATKVGTLNEVRFLLREVEHLIATTGDVVLDMPYNTMVWPNNIEICRRDCASSANV